MSPPTPQRSTSNVDDAVARLKFDAAGLLPAVVQDEKDGVVLMVAWMDAEAVRRTLTTGHTWFWSRSRRRYWQKGETSGNVQHVRSVTCKYVPQGNPIFDHNRGPAIKEIRGFLANYPVQLVGRFVGIGSNTG